MKIYVKDALFTIFFKYCFYYNDKKINNVKNY